MHKTGPFRNPEVSKFVKFVAVYTKHQQLNNTQNYLYFKPTHTSLQDFSLFLNLWSIDPPNQMRYIMHARRRRMRQDAHVSHVTHSVRLCGDWRLKPCNNLKL